MNIFLSHVIIYLPYVILEVRPCALVHTDSLFLATLYCVTGSIVLLHVYINNIMLRIVHTYIHTLKSWERGPGDEARH